MIRWYIRAYSEVARAYAFTSQIESIRSSTCLLVLILCGIQPRVGLIDFILAILGRRPSGLWDEISQTVELVRYQYLDLINKKLLSRVRVITLSQDSTRQCAAEP